MKEYRSPSYDLGNHTLEHAFSIVFNDDTLQKAHGEDIEITPWQDDKRTTEFHVGVDMIPWALRHLFWGSKLKVTVNQALNKADNCWKVSNQIMMHFIASKLFKIESAFELVQKDGHIFLTGGVKCAARLLPPLNFIAEGFMLNQCKKEITTYTEVVAKKIVAMSKD
jgi:hypothetical protein